MDVNKWISLGRKVHAFVKEQNQNGEYPTVKELARKYKLTNDEIITLVEDNGDLMLNIGVMSGGGYWIERNKGDYTVEADNI